MAERGRYRTRQQELILDCLREQKDVFLTVDQLMVYLGQKEIQVGQTTVYRTLDRLTGDGVVIRIPSVNGSKAQYRYLGEDETSEPGKMICLRCGRIVPLECSHLKEFSRHIRQEHGFLRAGTPDSLWVLQSMWRRTCNRTHDRFSYFDQSGRNAGSLLPPFLFL